MTNIIPIKPDTIKQTLLEIANKSEDLQGVVVLTIGKDNSSMILTSSLSVAEKAEMKCLFDAYIMTLFKLQTK